MNYLLSKFIDANPSSDFVYGSTPDRQQNGGGGGGSSSSNGGHSNGGSPKLLTGSGGIASKDGTIKKIKYKNWCANVERKCHSIVIALPSLDSLSSSDDKKKEKACGSLVKVTGLLGELGTLLDIVTYRPSNKGAAPIDGAQASQNNTDQLLSTSPPSSSSSSCTVPPLPTKQNSNSNLHSLASASSSSSDGKDSTSSAAPPLPLLPTKDRESSIGRGGRTMGDSSLGGSSQSENNSSSSGKESKSTTRAVATSCRDSMLGIWGALVPFVEKFYTIDKDLSAFYNVILQISRRKEFDTLMSPAFDPLTFKPWSNDVILKYRTKLYKTFSFVGMAISTTPFLSVALTQFCSKFIATAFFRIPKVAKVILEALVPPETEITDIISYYPCPQILKHLNVVGERPDKSPFHPLLMQFDNIEKELDIVPHGWIDNLARKENLFFIFLREWVGICKYVMGDNVDMKIIPGFFTLTYALLHEIKTRDQVVPPQFKTTPALEAHFALLSVSHNDTAMLDSFIKIIFLKTCVFDLVLVASTLGIVEAWIKEYGVLPDTFDIDFFCAGVDSIIAADHHQVVIRLLNLIYNTSDCFQGSMRQVLFRDLLLHKYFYHLFLHWDQPVRNAYHHILLYRMVRIKRSSLHQSGFSIGEFSKLTHNNTATTKYSLSPTKYPDKDEKNNDHSYNSSSRLASSTASIKQPKSPRSVGSPSSSLSTSPQPQSPLSSSGTKKIPPPVPPRSNLNSSSNSNSSSNNNNNHQLSIPTIEEPTDINGGSTSPLKNSYGDDAEPCSPRLAPETFEKYNKEFSIDLELFMEIEIYQKKVTDQFRQPELRFHDPKLSNYVAASLSEFKTYIAIGNQANATPPKIIPLMYQGPTQLNLNKVKMI
ncbi:hypothetical protein DFA_12016 [Cavenderia fasciculata]|uniref:Uncharacterized protein n=1 Tax=Cavenderia fasciculata TaxID=261658 RepID=F4QF92_CACFS|nr:uncharacterized protein DFA_12016 [Cavenderia fasciculata]EGG14246.1 hypothetical protein DFA_12016 [Cavenderia fasciculata]|eukprot:XP_004350955.1 hypothetical protein DFA_12016 [Cavenderia fasciculata]